MQFPQQLLHPSSGAFPLVPDRDGETREEAHESNRIRTLMLVGRTVASVSPRFRLLIVIATTF